MLFIISQLVRLKKRDTFTKFPSSKIGNIIFEGENTKYYDGIR